MESRLHLVISLVIALIFVGFAAVQYNDPDPITWIAIYGMMALLLLVNAYRRLPISVSVLPMLAAIVGAILLWPDEYQGIANKMDSRPGVELARESLGLAICALSCAYVAWRSWVRGLHSVQNY